MTLQRMERVFLGGVFFLPLLVILVGGAALLSEIAAGPQVTSPDGMAYRYVLNMQSNANNELSALSVAPVPNSADLFRAVFSELADQKVIGDRFDQVLAIYKESPTKPLTEEQIAIADGLLAEHQAMFARLETAAAGGDCMYVLDWSEGLETKLPHLSRIRQVQRLLCLRMEQHARRNDVEGILHDMELSRALAASSARDLTRISDMVCHSGLRMVAMSLERCLVQLPAPLEDAQLERLTLIVEQMLAQPKPKLSLRHDLIMQMELENDARDAFLREQRERSTLRGVAIGLGQRLLRVQEGDEAVWGAYIGSFDFDGQYPSRRVINRARAIIDFNRDKRPRSSIAWRRHLFSMNQIPSNNAMWAMRLRLAYAALTAERVRRAEGVLALKGIGERLAGGKMDSPWIDLHSNFFMRGYNTYQAGNAIFIQVRFDAHEGVQARGVGPDGEDNDGVRPSANGDGSDYVFSLWNPTGETAAVGETTGEAAE